MSPTVAFKFFEAHGTIRSIDITQSTSRSMFIQSESFDADDRETPDVIPFPPGTFPSVTRFYGPPYFFVSLLHASPQKLTDVSFNEGDAQSEPALRAVHSLTLLKKFMWVNLKITPTTLRELAVSLPNLTELTCFERVRDAAISFRLAIPDHELRLPTGSTMYPSHSQFREA